MSQPPTHNQGRTVRQGPSGLQLQLRSAGHLASLHRAGRDSQTDLATPSHRCWPSRCQSASPLLLSVQPGLPRADTATHTVGHSRGQRASCQPVGQSRPGRSAHLQQPANHLRHLILCLPTAHRSQSASEHVPVSQLVGRCLTARLSCTGRRASVCPVRLGPPTAVKAAGRSLFSD